MDIILGILVLVLLASWITFFFAIKNMVRKNEFMEDFIVTQSTAIGAMSKKLDDIDEKGIFKSDDMIGWFWEDMMEIKRALDEFRLR